MTEAIEQSVEALAHTVWSADSMDMGGYTERDAATVARAILASDWLDAHDTEIRAAERERVALAIEANWAGDDIFDIAIEDCARIARQEPDA